MQAAADDDVLASSLKLMDRNMGERFLPHGGTIFSA